MALNQTNTNFMIKVKDFAFILPSKNQDPENKIRTQFFQQIQKEYPFLRICGLEEDVNATNGFSIEYAPHEAVVEFNVGEAYDIDWFKNEIFALVNGIETELNLINDWAEIWDLIDSYVHTNYPIEYYWTRSNNKIRRSPFDPSIKSVEEIKVNGKDVFVNKAFVMTGNTIIPRYINAKSPLKLKGTAKADLKAITESMVIILQA